MTDSPDIPDVLSGGPSDVLGATAMVLWTTLTRRLVDKGLLSTADVQDVIKAAHTELAHEKGSEAAMALLARLAMNVA